MFKSILTFLLFVFLFLSRLTTFSQIAEMRNLQANLPKIKDSSVYVDALNRLAILSDNQYCDSCGYYAEKAYQIARRINYTKGIAGALRGKGIFCRTMNHYLSEKYFQESLKMYRSINDLENTCALLLHIGTNSWVNKNDKVAQRYYAEALKQSKSLKKDSVRSIVIIFNLDREKLNSPHYNQLFAEGKKIAEKYKDEWTILYYKRELARQLYSTNRKKEALILLKNSLKEAKQYNLKKLEVVFLSTIGFTLMRENQTSEGTRYLDQGLSLSNQYGYSANSLYFIELLFHHYKSAGKKRRLLIMPSSSFPNINKRKRPSKSLGLIMQIL